MEENVTDRKDLKIQALLEKVSNLTMNYENSMADLRVELTVVSQELQNAYQLLQEQQQNTEQQPDEVVHEITSVPADNSD